MELLGLALVVLVTLGTILFFTRGVFARDLTNALKRVSQQEQELQAKADVLEQRLRQLELDYHEKLKRADEEAQRITQEAKQQAVNVCATAVEEAKHRARQLVLEAEQARAQLKMEFATELNGAALQHASEALCHLLAPEELTAMHERLVRDALEALTRLDAAAVRQSSDEVEVTTARPLSAAASHTVTRWAATCLGPSVPVRIVTEVQLIAGCRVRVGQTTVENTLRSRLAQQG